MSKLANAHNCVRRKKQQKLPFLETKTCLTETKTWSHLNNWNSRCSFWLEHLISLTDYDSHNSHYQKIEIGNPLKLFP